MFKWLVLIIIIFIVFRFRKVKVKWKTLLKKGFSIERGNFGIYCYCGKQGSGKTFSAVEFLHDNQDLEIYSNIHLKGIKYHYIGSVYELLDLRSKKNIIIFYDEIFTLISKNSKLNTEFMDLLSQMRKRRQILVTTAQEWLEINMTFRRYCRYQIDCKCFNLIQGYIVKSFYDAEQMKWSQEDNEYIAPLITTTISKMRKKIANSYDTLEQINAIK